MKRWIVRIVKITLLTMCLMITVPAYIYSGSLIVQSFVGFYSINICEEFFQFQANEFMAEHGNRYFALDLVRYLKEKEDPYYCDDSYHSLALVKLYKKHPDMREAYLGAMVEGILDSKTTNFNRLSLIYYLEEITGKDFDGRDEDVEYDDMKPYTQKAIRNIAAWWGGHLEKNADAAIAATETDYKFPPPPPYPLKSRRNRR